MKRKSTVAIVLLLVCAVMLPMLASCSSCSNTPGPNDSKSYVYKDAVVALPTNWNPHTYQTETDSYPDTFLRTGLYGFVFNDALHPSSVEGVDDFAGYAIIPEMAADFPVDVTEQIKALDNNKFGIPASATSGYAYTIKLNPDAKWEDGTPINADTYVYSMQKLLDPELLNYRATDYYSGSFCIAGAEGYANSGATKLVDNGVSYKYTLADLTKGSDGQYVTKEGFKVYIGLDFALDHLDDYGLKAYVDAYGSAYFDTTNWETLVAKLDDDGVIPLTDENYALFLPVITGNPAWNETEADAPSYFAVKKEYPVVTYDTVGLYKSGDYEITMVLSKSLTDFYLLYALTGNWIVKQDLYEAGLSQDENGVWSSSYNSDVASTSSYGPYKLVDYVKDSSMRFERNENWYGYTDGQHKYIDPSDGKTYDMYQTTAITTQQVAEAATRKNMFLKGQLMGYGLQSDDFAQYRNSDYTYFTPSETIFFFIFNGYLEAIQEREANAGFDKTKNDLETMTLTSFRKAVAVTYDKEALCTAIQPSRSGGYGIIGNNYIYNPETGEKYRDTDYAKQALCDFYSVDTSKYASLDEAVASITGYDPEAAKVLYTQAFNEALEKGYITSADGKTCDQTIEITYSISESSTFQTKLINYLNEKMAEVTVGTPFEGKIKFVESAPLGDPGWADAIKAGTTDVVLGGWSGSALDPYGLTDLYCNPSNAYDAAWFDATKVTMTATVNGEELTMTMYQWSDALNGTTVTVNGKEYNFGYGFADDNTRLYILSKIEGVIMQTYDYIPMIQDASAALLSKQVYYVVEEYTSVMGRGGIAYMKYNYDETEWAEYVASQGGELTY